MEAVTLEHLSQYAVPAALVAWMWWRQMQTQRRNLYRVWILPAILVALASWGLVVNLALTWSGGLAVLGGLAFGVVLGLVRVRFMSIEACPGEGAVITKGSPWLILIMAAIVAVRRFYLKTAMHDLGMLGTSIMDFGLATAIAMLTVRTAALYWIYYRATRVSQPAPEPSVSAEAA